jgi:16S rRNA processing protein RimM
LAVLGRTWGRRGELTGISLTSGPERFAGLERVFLFGEKAGNEPQCLDLESVWEHRGQLVFKFRGVDTITDAERLERAEVRVPLSERAPLSGDEFYESDLVGCEVFERSNGERLGSVTALVGQGGPPLLEVRGAGAGEPLLVPFARAICVEINVEAKRILVELPAGLKEINVR